MVYNTTEIDLWKSLATVSYVSNDSVLLPVFFVGKHAAIYLNHVLCITMWFLLLSFLVNTDCCVQIWSTVHYMLNVSSDYFWKAFCPYIIIIIYFIVYILLTPLNIMWVLDQESRNSSVPIRRSCSCPIPYWLLLYHLCEIFGKFSNMTFVWPMWLLIHKYTIIMC